VIENQVYIVRGSAAAKREQFFPYPRLIALHNFMLRCIITGL
jgi:hypothetical protein